MAAHRSLRRCSIKVCTSGLKVRTVPTIVAVPGTTLIAPRSPDWMAHRLTTALSSALTLRETMLCTAVMMCAATKIGSTVR